jgi:dipeptidase D
MEDRMPVVLQSHLDMVHQKNADTEFDFAREGIRCRVAGDWVLAEGTTLGADNGIGVAAILALLESDDLSHPPLEALLTTDEETGMTGAKALQADWLRGKILLNLDTEDDEELTIGCAGGIDTNTSLPYREEPAPGGSAGFRLQVRGLRGGHSGMDIHLGRGNANKLITRLLYGMPASFDMRIAALDGGGLRNAIPREAVARLAVAEKQKDAFIREMHRRSEAILEEYRPIEPNLRIQLEEHAPPPKVMEATAQEQALRALYAVHNGVYRMSPYIENLVETSSNLARVLIGEGRFETQSMQRSSLESGKEDVANAVGSPFEAIGAHVTREGDYPGWSPNPSSPVLSVMKHVYDELFEGKPKVAACHAGLECGIIGNRYPEMDMISFGPTIQHAHSPDERVSISSVQKFWKYLLATLERIPVVS